MRNAIVLLTQQGKCQQWLMATSLEEKPSSAQSLCFAHDIGMHAIFPLFFLAKYRCSYLSLVQETMYNITQLG